jgi:hypothetical protein
LRLNGVGERKGPKDVGFHFKNEEDVLSTSTVLQWSSVESKITFLFFAKKMEYKVFIFYKLPSSLVPSLIPASFQTDLFVLLLHVGSCHNHGVVKLAASV